MNSKIMLIETDRPLASNLIEYLKGNGFEVQWHVDPQIAINGIDDEMPDLVLMEMVMAGRSGTEFLYELRSYGDLQNLPVVIYSSISNRELGQSELAITQLNVAEFLYKPETSFRQIVNIINQILQKPKIAHRPA